MGSKLLSFKSLEPLRGEVSESVPPLQTDTINILFLFHLLFLRQVLTNIQGCGNEDYDTDGDVLRIGAYTKVL